MSPMFNSCMNAGAGGPTIGPPQPNGPMPPHNGPGPNDPGFYNPAPHFNNTAHHPQNNFNNNLRNINTRTPFFISPDFKIYELVRRLTDRPEDPDNTWWDSFVSEFFDDNSTLTINFSLEDGPKRYTIGRTLIPRYFRTMFEGGVQDFSIRLKRPCIKDSPNRILILECDHCTLITQHGKPGGYNKHLTHYSGIDPLMMKENKDIGLVVTTEGKLVLEFVQDDSMRIRSWNFSTSHFQEFILKNLVAVQAQQDSNMLNQLTKNVTRQGLTSSTLNYLKLCVLLEPMQLLMSRQREMDGSTPRDCLKNVLFTRWQSVCAPQEQQRPQSKRRKRKSSTPNNAGGGGGNKKKNNTQMSPGAPNFPLATQDVMVVGEPSLMGGELGEEDERVITRLENNQYDSSSIPTNGLDESDDFAAALGGQPPSQSQPISNQQQNSSQNSQIPSNNQGQLNNGPPQNQVPSNQNQWQPGPSLNQISNVNGPVNNSNNNGPNGSIHGNGVANNNPSSIEDKKPSPVSQ